ncbi:MAG: hypothetical protein ACOX7J_00230 [Bacillota bacterium]|jgi:hypothetical protein
MMFDNETSTENQTEITTGAETETPAAESDIDIDLFDDEDDETKEDMFDDADEAENDDGETEEETNPEPPEEDNPAEDKYTLKHLNEEREVTLDEMRRLAQKGLDYDHVREGYDNYRKLFDEISEASGLSPEEFIGEYRRELTEEKVRERTAEIMENDLVSQEVAERTAKAEIELESIKKGREAAAKKQEQAQDADSQQKAAVIRDVEYLQKIRPETAEVGFKIPEQVLERMRENGTPLSTEYLGWIAEQNEIKVKKMEQAEKNRKKSVGSMKSNGNSEHDEFIDALFSD